MEESHMYRGWGAAVLVAALGAGGVARAHEFECRQQVNGQPVVTVSEFPATLRFDYRVTNLHPTHESVAVRLEDAVLAPRGWRFKHAAPLTVPVGSSVDSVFMLHLDSHEECLALAAEDGADDGLIDTSFRVVWPLGEDQCGARISCPLVPPPPDDCGPSSGCNEPIPTRSEGFFKVHEQMLQRCLSRGEIHLGALGSVSTLPEALGVLWGSPSLHRSGEPRGELDALRFLLARQVLVGHCNARIFDLGSRFRGPLQQAQQALESTSCARLGALTKMLRTLNLEGTELPLPRGLKPGPATPEHAQRTAHDFTQPGGQSCADGQ
jgi:hypothetical protein